MRKWIIVVLVLMLVLTGCDSQDYSSANELFENGKYAEALTIYEALGNYENAPEQALECKYQLAQNLQTEKELSAAIAAYTELGSYKDSAEMAKSCEYELACSLQQQGDYDGALEHFIKLADYNDSNEKAQSCKKEIGMRENADYDFLADIEKSILGRMDSASTGTADHSSLVNTELAYLEKYQSLSFYDAELEKLAHKYIDGLLIQKEALKKVQIYEYQISWQEGSVYRYEVLSELYSKYNFLTDNTEFVGTYVSQYADQKALLDAYYAIEEDIAAQLTDDVMWNYKDNQIYYTVKNNTAYTYSTVFQVYFYDSEGTQYESGEAVIENIAPGSSYVISVYLFDTSRFDYFLWYNYYTDIK